MGARVTSINISEQPHYNTFHLHDKGTRRKHYECRVPTPNHGTHELTKNTVEHTATSSQSYLSHLSYSTRSRKCVVSKHLWSRIPSAAQPA